MGGGAGAPGRRGASSRDCPAGSFSSEWLTRWGPSRPLCLDTSQEHGRPGERAQVQVAPAPPSRGHLGTAGAPWGRPVSWPAWCRATGTVGRARAKACSPRAIPSCRAIWQPCHRQANANRGQGVREATRQQTADARATNREARLQHRLFQTVISHSPFGRRFSSSGCAVSPSLAQQWGLWWRRRQQPRTDPCAGPVGGVAPTPSISLAPSSPGPAPGSPKAPSAL